MTSPAGNLGQLEQQRQRLEQNVRKIRALLDEWKQWKNEYENLKKEVDLLPPDASPKLMKTMRASFDGNLVDDDELAKIFGDGGSQKPSQVISTLVNRIDYVKRNITTMEKRLETAQKELAALNLHEDEEHDASEDEGEYVPEDEGYGGDDGGLPVTEILEELDDDDNVVSYSLRTPGNNQSELLEALEKAGVKELPASPGAAEQNIKQVERQTPKPQPQETLAQAKAATTGDSPKPKPQKKSVKFAEDTKPAKAVATPANKPVAAPSNPKSKATKPADEKPEYMSFTAKDIDELMREAKQQESIISDPVIPADDSEEAAQLRRDMLEYNLSELNPVVAELTLEEGGLTDEEEDDDWDIDLDEEEGEDDDEDEDQWGRSKRSVVNEEYRLKMLEIQQRLQGHTFDSPETHNDSDDDNGDDPKEGIATIRVKTEESKLDSTSYDNTGVEPDGVSGAKKSVRFAPALDVAEKPTPSRDSAPLAQLERPEVDPLSQTIVERKSNAPPPTAPVTKKASRFKMARGEASPSQTPTFKAPVSIDGSVINPELPVSEQQFAPSGPEGKTMAASVLEHAPSERAREPDEFDADMLKQQAAVEYHKVRNRMIQKQGGFMKEDESPIRPLDEEEGGPKRLSRFKAARLAKS
ncbi:Prefoldin subunit-domain-containing protein [Truncatella angustata]|uniref:Prefoldin subunit-domain-containing protein n=1 Tax=Truncatella angustata TaxID=152316 RepID=A0A9P8US57_9PEZI|nr:Prefoldin subunit-domain-containing protein [Truncatella angustata]KAH6657248.1 Prefoldin subunit-domain-containing protein [Truncatella angustata]